jgi:hypothetical protein
MSEIATTSLPPLKTSDVRHPFGLPLGSVRGLMSILICAFFWILLLLPNESPAKAVLAHFFLLGLVLMAFSSSPSIADRDVSPFLPWLLRAIFVGGSIAVVAYVLLVKNNIGLLQTRMTPDPQEVKDWWIIFFGTLCGGFSFGLFIRFILGRANHIFQAIRAWFSVAGLIMLALEIAIFFAMANGPGKIDDFLHYWQCVELAVVAAYFGTRA